jgi:hypothetical protein
MRCVSNAPAKKLPLSRLASTIAAYCARPSNASSKKLNCAESTSTTAKPWLAQAWPSSK